jgi:H+/Cl- antiporter ClcA
VYDGAEKMTTDRRSAGSTFGLGTEEIKRRHILPKALVVGLVAGALGSAFRASLLAFERMRIEFLSRLPPPERLPLAIVVGTAGGATSSPLYWYSARWEDWGSDNSRIWQDRRGLRNRKHLLSLGWADCSPPWSVLRSPASS